MLNDDYKDILRALNDEKVEYLLVGAYAMAVHGYPRATMDIDLWVNPTAENADSVLRALKRFGAPLYDLTEADLKNDDTIFQIGVAPCRITGVTGLQFDAAAKRSTKTEFDGIPVHILSIGDIITNKRSTGRTKDLADAEYLESQTGPRVDDSE
jgi:hypothetical protein